MARGRVTDEMLTAAMQAYCGHVSGRPDPDRLRSAIQAALDVENRDPNAKLIEELCRSHSMGQLSKEHLDLWVQRIAGDTNAQKLTSPVAS